MLYCYTGRLAVCSKNTQFLCYYTPSGQEQPSFLIGANQAWQNYMMGDFGDRKYFLVTMPDFMKYLIQLNLAGGNTIRKFKMQTLDLNNKTTFFVFVMI